MAKIQYLEATDMGNGQQEIAEKCLEFIDERDFPSPETFSYIEPTLIAKACGELGWHSIPNTGGLIVYWATASGEFEL